LYLSLQLYRHPGLLEGQLPAEFVRARDARAAAVREEESLREAAYQAAEARHEAARLRWRSFLPILLGATKVAQFWGAFLAPHGSRRRGVTAEEIAIARATVRDTIALPCSCTYMQLCFLIGNQSSFHTDIQTGHACNHAAHCGARQRES
jgi:hypothetical protein